MKKILLFTSILFLVFSANLKAQTLDSVIVTSPMLCNGDDATVEAYVTQTSPSTSIQFRAYWFATSAFVTIFGSSDQTTGSQQPFTSNQCGDFIMLIVDSTLFAANAPTAPFQHSQFVQALSDPSILGSYNYTINCAPPQLSATTTSNADNLCFGDCIAEESLLISGGNMPYSFNINGGVMQTISTGNTQDFVALCAGTYNIEVIDSNACQTSPQITTFIISEPPEIIPNGSITSNFNGAHISCFGGSDGQITASATGGTGPFEYSIDGITFTSGSVFNGLTATTYTISYRDANNCITTEQFTLNGPPALSGLLSETQSVSCYGVCDGELTFSVDGTQTGTPPYQYSIDGLTFYNSGIFSVLCGNIAYDVIVEDANGCQYTASYFLSEPTAISYSTIITAYNGFESSCMFNCF